MSKTLVIIGFIILLVIGGKILFPQKNPIPETPLNSAGDVAPAKAAVVGPMHPPAPSTPIKK